MDDRTVMLRGPFSDDHIRRIYALMHSIDNENPEALYEIFIDDPRTDSSIERILEQIPVEPGYERITRYIPKDKRDC